MDQKAVGWDEVARITHPHVYMIGSHQPGSLIWVGALIVDRDHHRAYIQSNGN